MKTLAKLGCVVAACLFAAPDATACDLSIVSEGSGDVRGFSGLEGETVLQPVRLRLRNSGDTSCSGTIAFRQVAADARLRAAHGGSLRYRLVDERAGQAVLFDPEMSLAMPVALRVGPQSTVSFSPRLRMEAGQGARSGRYSARVDAVFTDTDKGVEAAREPVELRARVAPRVEANWVGVSRGAGTDEASLDLGELRRGLVRRAALQMRSNSDVTVEVESINRGSLQHGTDASSRIRYGLRLDGEAVDLSGVSVLRDRKRRGHKAGRNLPVSIVVGDTSRARAGEYSDTILVRISAR